MQPLIMPNENWRLLLGARTARLIENSLHFPINSPFRYWCMVNTSWLRSSGWRYYWCRKVRGLTEAALTILDLYSFFNLLFTVLLKVMAKIRQNVSGRPEVVCTIVRRQNDNLPILTNGRVHRPRVFRKSAGRISGGGGPE